MLRCGQTTYQSKGQYDQKLKREQYLKEEGLLECLENNAKEKQEHLDEGVIQGQVYVLCGVDNDTKTFIVKKEFLPKDTFTFKAHKIRYAYLEELSALIGYNILIKSLDEEKSIDLEGKSRERIKYNF